MRNSQNLCSGLLRNLDYILQYMYSYGDTKSFYSQLMSEADALLVNKKKVILMSRSMQINCQRWLIICTSMNYNDHNDEEIHQNLDVYANTRT